MAGASRRQIVREVVIIVAAIALYFGVRGLIATRVDIAYQNSTGQASQDAPDRTHPVGDPARRR